MAFMETDRGTILPFGTAKFKAITVSDTLTINQTTTQDGPLIVDFDDQKVVDVRKDGDGQSVFIVDTVNEKVGIGTDNPQVALDININDNNNGIIDLENTNNSGFVSIDFHNNTSQLVGFIGQGNTNVSRSELANSFYFGSKVDDPVKFLQNDQVNGLFDTNGNFIVRQPGGTAGTDEVQIYHDGTNTVISGQNNRVDFDSPAGIINVTTGNQSAAALFLDERNSVNQFSDTLQFGKDSNIIEQKANVRYDNVDIIGINSNSILSFNDVSSGENFVEISNAADQNTPTINAIGDDTNIDLGVVPKGSGAFVVQQDNGNNIARFRPNDTTVFYNGIDAGPIQAAEDTYQQLIDQNITSALSAGDQVGYTFAVDNNAVVEVSAEADGSGGIQNEALVVRDAGGTAGADEARLSHENGGLLLKDTTGTPLIEDGAGNRYKFTGNNFFKIGGGSSLGSPGGAPFEQLFLTTDISDNSDNELLSFSSNSSAVNHVDVANAATGNAPVISAAGDDTDIDVDIQPKGSGSVNLQDVMNMNVLSSAPSNPDAGDIYIDDGSNTSSGNVALRVYNGTSWVDQN